MAQMQLSYDVLRILDWSEPALEALGGAMTWMLELARAGKLAQGRFVARKRPHE